MSWKPFISAVAVLLFLNDSCNAQRRRLGAGVSQVEFDCPEEFGYYAHPTDCTQYYVCVFGGALLESCTGGLMYSHELQTCDWPRNVGCNSGGESPTVSTIRVTDPRTRHTTPAADGRSVRPSPSPVPVTVQTRNQEQDELSKAQYPLYTDEVGPAEEQENERQQRVYRGQPATVGQVARDRDGLRHAVTNSIPSSTSGRVASDKIISYTGQQQQYRPDPSRAPVYSEPAVQVSATPSSRPVLNQYNSSQFGTQYDPYYALYDEDVELYRDVDYSQYSGGQNTYSGQRQQQPQQPQQPQQQQNTYTGGRANTFSQPSYRPEVQNVYTQSVGSQDYNDYNSQDEQLQYRQQQSTRAPPRENNSASRNRGSASYVSSNAGSSSSGRSRPTLKPSTAIVSKASEYIDIYRFPPNRPPPVYPQPRTDQPAAKCRRDICLLPDCSCGGKEVPGGFEPEQIPQIVLLTFDDSVNDLNKELYKSIFEKGRRNANGCPISGTFYVSHEWTDYSQVQNLYADGHEIASHSISHSFGEQFSQKKWTKEIAGQREILSAYGGVRLEDIRGMRAPFLAIGGNKMFKMLYDANFTYDSSMPIYENRPPSWPYTLDYKVFHDCMIPPCPTRSYPGVWEVPMVMWQDLNGGRCSMGDACSNPPTADGVYKMLIKNFERHYTTNRAPFGLYYHAAWFTQPHHKEGFLAFLDTITSMEDVWLVTNWQAIQWMRDPTPLSRINNFRPWQCNYPERPRRCNNPKVCNLWHKSGVRYMRTCQPCPDIYPWTGKTGVRNSRVDNEIDE